MSLSKSITIQMGHVPRTSGSTGTVGEQEFTKTLGPLLYNALKTAGWTAYLIEADPPGRQYPNTSLFLALHCDGNANPKAQSASFFYPSYNPDQSWLWGMKWAAAHQSVAGYKWGFRDPNYVSSVSSGFYAWLASRRAIGQATPAPVCLLAEHFFATNPEEYAWSREPGKFAQMAMAHVVALQSFIGDTTSPLPPITSEPQPTPSTPGEDDDMIYKYREPSTGVTHYWVSSAFGFRYTGRDTIVGVDGRPGLTASMPNFDCDVNQIKGFRDSAARVGTLDEPGLTTTGLDPKIFATTPPTMARHVAPAITQAPAPQATDLSPVLSAISRIPAAVADTIKSRL